MEKFIRELYGTGHAIRVEEGIGPISHDPAVGSHFTVKIEAAKGAASEHLPRILARLAGRIKVALEEEQQGQEPPKRKAADTGLRVAAYPHWGKPDGFVVAGREKTARLGEVREKLMRLASEMNGKKPEEIATLKREVLKELSEGWG